MLPLPFLCMKPLACRYWKMSRLNRRISSFPHPPCFSSIPCDWFLRCWVSCNLPHMLISSIRVYGFSLQRANSSSSSIWCFVIVAVFSGSLLLVLLSTFVASSLIIALNRSLSFVAASFGPWGIRVSVPDQCVICVFLSLVLFMYGPFFQFKVVASSSCIVCRNLWTVSRWRLLHAKVVIFWVTH